MSRRLALWSSGIVATLVALLAASSALAQEVTIGYQGLPYKASGESGTGILVTDGLVLHVGAGVEGGYDSNVFYSDNNRVGAAIYRTTIFGDLTNANRTGPVSQVSLDARAGVQYRRYQFTGSEPASADTYKNAWMPTAGISIGMGSGQLGFGLADTFARVEDPPYAAGLSMITRDNNQGSVEARWSPGGGRLTTTLRYTNMIDVFEDNELRYGSTDTNTIMVDASWKWLPKTAIFLNAQQGYIFYLHDSRPAYVASSYPLHVTTGLRGLLTPRTSAILSVGYVNAFYSNPSGKVVTTSGFLGSTFAELAFTVQPTAVSRVVVGARHDFENGIVSSFAYTDTAYLSYVHQLFGRLALDVSGRVARRNFQGFYRAASDPAPTPRVDYFYQVGASLDYFVRNWAYVGVGYALLANDSNLADPALQVNYLKNQIFARLGITY